MERDEAMTGTVEHILPENSGEQGWEHFSPEAHDRSWERLGNYSLLERSLNNRQAANAAFSQKVDAYKQSQYRISKDLNEYSEWTEETISERQLQMAKTAKAVWVIQM